MQQHSTDDRFSNIKAFLRFAVYFTVIYLTFFALFLAFGLFGFANARVSSEMEDTQQAETGTDAEDESSPDPDEESSDENGLVKEVGSRQESDSNELDPRIPTRIVAPAIDLEHSIVNPHSRDIDALNKALKEGVTYYPRSGYLGQESNIFLFGHSSHLPVVINKNYKAFNRISELDPGDPVYLEVGNERYVYKVTKSYEAKDHEIIVDFESDSQRLTLATCNVFGEQEDRFIIEAELAKKEKMR